MNFSWNLLSTVIGFDKKNILMLIRNNSRTHSVCWICRFAKLITAVAHSTVWLKYCFKINKIFIQINVPILMYLDRSLMYTKYMLFKRMYRNGIAVRLICKTETFQSCKTWSFRVSQFWWKSLASILILASQKCKVNLDLKKQCPNY